MDVSRQDASANADSNTGRWTKSEHELFLKGLNDYGKDWKQIGSLIKTRTVVQIRTHAQKYFLAAKKHEDPSSAMMMPAKTSTVKKRASSSSLVSASSTPKAKAKKRKDEGEELTQPETRNNGPPVDHLDTLDKFFDLVDAWSSGSDEGTPSALDELDFLKHSGLSGFNQLPVPEEVDSSASSSPAPSQPPSAFVPASTSGYTHQQFTQHPHAQQHLPANYEFHPVVAHPQPTYQQPQSHPHAYPNNQYHGQIEQVGTSRSHSNTQLQPAARAVSMVIEDVPPLSVTPTPEMHDLAGTFVDPLPPSLEYMILGRWIDTMTE